MATPSDGRYPYTYISVSKTKMAKLTPEQKALNKAATKLRDQAFRQRHDAYLAEVQAVKAANAAGAEALEALAADKAVTAALATRDEAVNSIEVQIQMLTQKLAETRREHEALIAPMSVARKVAWDKRWKALDEALAPIATKYSDVATCGSAAEWKPYQDFIPQAAANLAS